MIGTVTRNVDARVAAADHRLSILPLAGLVAIAGGLNPIPFRTRPLNSPAPMILRLKTRESRSLPGPPKADSFFEPSRSRMVTSKTPPFGAAVLFMRAACTRLHRQ